MADDGRFRSSNDLTEFIGRARGDVGWLRLPEDFLDPLCPKEDSPCHCVPYDGRAFDNVSLAISR